MLAANPTCGLRPPETSKNSKCRLKTPKWWIQVVKLNYKLHKQIFTMFCTFSNIRTISNDDPRGDRSEKHLANFWFDETAHTTGRWTDGRWMWEKEEQSTQEAENAIRKLLAFKKLQPWRGDEVSRVYFKFLAPICRQAEISRSLLSKFIGCLSIKNSIRNLNCIFPQSFSRFRNVVVSAIVKWSMMCF